MYIPKCLRRTLYVQLRPPLGEVFRQMARHKESRIEEGHLMSDHDVMISIPPKYPVSQVVGYIKGKSAILLARVYWSGSGTSSDSISRPGIFCVHGGPRRGGSP